MKARVSLLKRTGALVLALGILAMLASCGETKNDTGLSPAAEVTTIPATEATTAATTEAVTESPQVTTEEATEPTELTTEETTEPTEESSEPPEETAESTEAASEPEGTDYVLNTNTKKFHYPDCGSVSRMKESNKEFYTGSRDDLIARGYDPCGNCDP